MSSLKEFPLRHDVLSYIPQKIHYAFSSTEVKLTCFDASSNQLVFGTNAGCAFLYNRESGNIVKLLCDNKHDHVSSVKLLLGLDCQIAMGTKYGKISIVIFSHSASGTVKQIRKFSMGKLHNAEITEMEWSMNGMKLFSGDADGSIYCTDVNFESNTCNANLLHGETGRIVQLHYRHKLLLISTSERSVLLTHDGRTIQIGTKASRNGNYGACFNNGTLTEEELKIYASRPSFRIWTADIQGLVVSTITMKNIIENATNVIDIYGAESRDMSKSRDDQVAQFGRIVTFGDSCLVTYADSSLFVIDVSSNTLVGMNRCVSETVQVQVTGDEIFILRSDRRFHRLSYKADQGAKFETLESKENPLQNVKGSLLEMKKSFSPILGSFQTKMNAMNAKTEKFTSKLQLQTKELKEKVSSSNLAHIADSLLASAMAPGSKSANQSSPNLNEAKDDTPLAEIDQEILKKMQPDDFKVIKQLLSDIIDQIDDSGYDDTLHLRGTKAQPKLVPSPFMVRKEDDSKFNDGGYLKNRDISDDIVFSSKIRKKPKKTKGVAQQTVRVRTNNLVSVMEQRRAVESVEPDMTSVHGVQTTSPAPSDQYNSSESRGSEPTNDSSPSMNHDVPHSSNSYADDESIKFKNTERFLACSVGEGREMPSNVANFDVDVETGDTHCAANATVSSDVDVSTGDTPCADAFNIACTSLQDHSTKAEINKKDGSESRASPSRLTDQAWDRVVNQVSRDPVHGSRSDVLRSGEYQSQQPQVFRDVTAEIVDDVPDDDINPHHCPCQQQELVTDQTSRVDASDGNKTVPVEATPGLVHDTSPPTAQVTTGSDVGSDDEPDIYSKREAVDFESEVETGSESDDESKPEADTSLYVSDEQVDERDRSYFEAVQQYFPTGFDDLTSGYKTTDVWISVRLSKRNIASICASGNWICYITHSDRIHMTEENTESLYNMKWLKLTKKACQISISPSVGVSEAWVVSQEKKVSRQVGLSRAQPCMEGSSSVDVTIVKGKEVIHDAEVTQVALACDVVWILTVDGHAYCKPLERVDDAKPWFSVERPVSSDGKRYLLKKIVTDGRSSVWAVSEIGQLWYRSKVTRNCPCGDTWWQGYMNKYTQDNCASKAILSQLAVAKETVQSSMSPLSRRGSSLARQAAISMGALWVITEDDRVKVARGAVTGNVWKSPNIQGIPSSATWRHITSSSTFSADNGGWEGVIWAARHNGEIIRFPSTLRHSEQRQRAVVVPPPVEPACPPIRCVSACRDALWVIIGESQVFVRSGVSEACPAGTEWNVVDVSEQLGSRKLVHVSCGSQCVWGLDETGHVYLRMGVAFTENHVTMCPVWLPLEPNNLPHDGRFVQVECGPSDLHVWALDNLGNVYVRLGVTSEMPVGERWRFVEGSTATRLTISNHTVWALRPDGSILKRFGISRNDCTGDYWSEIPVKFHDLTATPYDELWAIDTEERLRGHVTRTYRPPLYELMLDEAVDDDDQCEQPVSSRDVLDKDDGSWEFL